MISITCVFSSSPKATLDNPADRQLRAVSPVDDVSQFDTPQDNVDDGGHIVLGSDERVNINKDIHDYDDDEINDQLLVLVEHHGSDDELVIDIDSGAKHDNSDNVFSEKHEIDVEEDQDLLDAPTFARNGSITTIDIVSEGSLAFNSVSVHPSVSSLGSSGEESDNEKGYGKHKMVSI